jgi:hypothetical protein
MRYLQFRVEIGQGGSHAARGVVEPRLGGPFGNPQGVRDIRNREIQVVAEDEDDTIHCPQAFERVADDATRLGVVRRRNKAHIAESHGPASTAGRVDGCVNHDSTHPWVESSRIAQRGQASPSPEQAILNSVFGSV